MAECKSATAAVNAIPEPDEPDAQFEDALSDAVRREHQAQESLEDYLREIRNAGGPLAFVMPDGTLVAGSNTDSGLAIVPADRVHRLV